MLLLTKTINQKIYSNKIPGCTGDGLAISPYVIYRLPAIQVLKTKNN